MNIAPIASTANIPDPRLIPKADILFTRILFAGVFLRANRIQRGALSRGKQDYNPTRKMLAFTYVFRLRSNFFKFCNL